MADGTQLGDLLLDAGLVTRDQLEWGLEVQRRTGSLLGTILVASGVVRRLDLYRALADQWRLPYIDLATRPLSRELLARVAPDTLLEHGFVPVERAEDGLPIVATARPPTPEQRMTIGRALGEPVHLAATTDWDVSRAVQRGYRDEVLDRAAMGLWRRTPVQSAREVLIPRQRTAMIAAALMAAAAAVLAPRWTVVTISLLVSLGLLAAVTYKFVVCLVGSRHERTGQVTEEEIAALNDADLPVYTVLVPVFREANVVGDLVANLSALDYPSHKLEILLLLESGDEETIAAAHAARPPSNVVFLVVPKGAPQTKPKACNVGLFFARGDYLVIYDAEDKPEPDQLKKALVMFERAGDDLVCVQAALNYWNAEENVLTRMFTLEYSFWFDYMLPGLDELRLPIPLGGTSNHFRVDALRRLGGWDPFNVTEDADLGIRASALGYRVGVVNSTTFEEASTSGPNWVRQRSRWIKGYMQTLLVHLRQPRELVRTAGAVQTAGFLLLIGGTPLTFLFTPPLYLLFAVTLLVPRGGVSQFFPGVILWICLANLLAGNAMMIYVSMMGAFKRRRYRLVLWGLLNPAYWLLHSIASYKALWQLVTKPHYWEKTLHGLSSFHPGSGHADVGASTMAG